MRLQPVRLPQPLATSRGTRRSCQRVQGQPVLPDDRGVHPAGHPRQRPGRVVRAAVSDEITGTSRTATPARARAKVDHEGRRRGRDARRHPPPGLLARSGRCCWCGRTPRPSCPELIRIGQGARPPRSTSDAVDGCRDHDAARGGRRPSCTTATRWPWRASPTSSPTPPATRSSARGAATCTWCA